MPVLPGPCTGPMRGHQLHVSGLLRPKAPMTCKLYLQQKKECPKNQQAPEMLRTCWRSSQKARVIVQKPSLFMSIFGVVSSRRVGCDFHEYCGWFWREKVFKSATKAGLTSKVIGCLFQPRVFSSLCSIWKVQYPTPGSLPSGTQSPQGAKHCLPLLQFYPEEESTQINAYTKPLHKFL